MRRESDDSVACAGSQDESITEEDLVIAYEGTTDEVRNCSATLYAKLVTNTDYHPQLLVHNCPGGNGLEAMRILMRGDEPKTPVTKRVIWNAIIHTCPSMRAEDMERNLLEVEKLLEKSMRSWPADR